MVDKFLQVHQNTYTIYSHVAYRLLYHLGKELWSQSCPNGSMVHAPAINDWEFIYPQYSQQ